MAVKAGTTAIPGLLVRTPQGYVPLKAIRESGFDNYGLTANLYGVVEMIVQGETPTAAILRALTPDERAFVTNEKFIVSSQGPLSTTTTPTSTSPEAKVTPTTFTESQTSNQGGPPDPKEGDVRWLNNDPTTGLWERFTNGKWVQIPKAGQPVRAGTGAGIGVGLGVGQQAPAGVPQDWPQVAPYFWKYAITGYEPMVDGNGKAILDFSDQPVLKPRYEQVPDFDAAIRWAQGFQDAAHQTAAQSLASAKFEWEKQQAEAQVPTAEQQIDRALAEALEKGDFSEVQRIRTELSRPTELQAAEEARRVKEEERRAKEFEQGFGFAQTTEERRIAEEARRARGFGQAFEFAQTEEDRRALEASRAGKGFEQAFGFAQNAEQRAYERAMLENLVLNARNQRESDAAAGELARLDAQEVRTGRGFEQAFGFAGTAEQRRLVEEQRRVREFEEEFGVPGGGPGQRSRAFEQAFGIANAEENRRAAAEGRVALAFPLSQELLRQREARAASEESFGQGLRNRQFGLQEQEQRAREILQNRQIGLQELGQAFGQGQERLRAGLDILRSPGDQFLYQSRLRGDQPNQPFQPGGTAVSRNAFLGSFGEGAGAGSQEFRSFLQPEGGQPQSAPFGIGQGLQQAFAGQPVTRPRQLPSLGAPPFIGLQQERNLLPSEREMRLAEVGAQGFYLPDFEEQERRQNPRAFLASSQAFRTAARPRVF